MSRPFKFNAEKTIQAIAFLLSREPAGRMNYMRLLKLLYIAEREALSETSAPMTGSAAVAMERGPVLEDVYALIRSQHPDCELWDRFLHVEHYHIVLHADPGKGKLTRYIVNKLEEISKRYQDDDEWSMVEKTHEFPEWKANDPGKSSKPIPLSDILSAIGRADDIDYIVGEARREPVPRAAYKTVA